MLRRNLVTFRIIHDDDLLKLDLENLVYILKISWFCMVSYPVPEVVVTTVVVIVVVVVAAAVKCHAQYE